MRKETNYCKIKNYKMKPYELKRCINLKNTVEISTYDSRTGNSQRALLLRRERIYTVMPVLFAVFATACMVFICAVSYRSIRTNASSGFKYYTSVTVENGQTLWDIADEFIDYDYYKNKNSYIAEVKSINHLDENCSIDAGQILILPYYSDQYIK